MSTSSRTQVYIGSIVHSLSLDEIEYVSSAVLGVREGKIEWAERDVDVTRLEEVLGKYGLERDVVDVVELAEGEFLSPGFVDTHTHAPQYPNIGLGGTYQLLEWLERLTFPEEAKYGDMDYAREVYEQVVGRTLRAGTTTSCYYASLHVGSSKLLADICQRQGQRAYIGRCCMDRNCPQNYIESSAETSLSATHDFLSHFSLSPDALVQPILTPRFAISCTPQLLHDLGELSRSHDPPLAVQTHLSENPAEVVFAKELFPDCGTYAGVYEKYGLLHSGTILAHCVHLDDEEREVISRTGAGIAHCPTSNINLNSGSASVQKMLDSGIKVGLGTDVSGGYALGILPVIRAASTVSRCLMFSGEEPRGLSTAQLFYMATRGGASLCRLEKRIGAFEVGMEFDAIRVGPKSPGYWPKVGESLQERIEKWIWTGDDRDIAEVWVRGRKVV